VEVYFESYGWKWESLSTAHTWLGYYAKYVQLNGYDLRSQPFYLIYNGEVAKGLLDNTGFSVHYWASTAASDLTTYNLYFEAIVAPSNFRGRYYGFSIRCLAR